MTKRFRADIKWLGGFYRPLKTRLILIAGQSVAVAAISAVIPYVFIGIIDGLHTNLSLPFLLRSVAILLGLGVLNFLTSVTNATRRAKTNIELEWRFRQSAFSRLIKLDQRFFSTYRIGDMVTRLTDDVGRKLSWFACSGLFRAWESTLRVCFCLIAMIIINPWLTLAAFIPFPLQILIYIKTGQVLDARFKHLQKLISRVNETIETCFSGIKIVQAYSRERHQAELFALVAEERARAEVNAEKAHIFVHSLYGYFWQLTQVFVLLAGGWMVIGDRITVGEFVAFNYYVSFLVWPMFDIGGLLVGYRRAAVSIKRLQELEGWETKILTPEQPTAIAAGGGRVRFENVSFRLEDKQILDRIGFDCGAARMIGVVGEVGSGKSTLLNLICRFFDPDEGSVLLDGVPLPQWPLDRLRHTIGYVSQEPLLFTDSVRNNVRFGRDWIDDHTIEWAARLARLDEEVKHFRDGYDTAIGLRGMTVSGGQKQRISIARALAGKPDLLLLDDATAHLDAETEMALWDCVFGELPEMRVFFVSHRTATLERADLILVLSRGCLVEHGTHAALMAARGEYYRIYSRRRLQEQVNTLK
ncbi:ABC transporter ATP-binding protein [bacterium]|nr:ABC transporter ATP-binding protein [candidate division CSSED10-310 bacterium]